jgi:hypothetical protein
MPARRGGIICSNLFYSTFKGYIEIGLHKTDGRLIQI